MERTRSTTRGPLRRLWWASPSLLLLTACNFGGLTPMSEQGGHVLWLYRFMWYFAILVGATVYGLILWSVLRYRRRRREEGELPPQFRYHVPLEILYTMLPIVIVIVLFVATFHTETKVDAVSPDPGVNVEVTAFQWQWRFTYPDYGISVVGTPSNRPTMVVPVGRPVHVTLVAEDVDHAFFIPEFWFKRDAIPGVDNVFDLTIPRPGRFIGMCAEFCGLNHDDMFFWVKAVPMSEFRRWTSSRQAAAGGTATPAPSPTGAGA